MRRFPLPRLSFSMSRRWFHNLIVALDRFDLIPAGVWLLTVAAATALVSRAWPGAGWFAFIVTGSALLIEAALIYFSQLAERSPSPFGGPFFSFSVGHLLASGITSLLPVPLSGAMMLHVLFQYGLLAAMVYGSQVEPFRVRLRRARVKIGRGGPGRLKLLIVSDLHLDRAGAREAAVLRLAREFRPDLVILPGDLTNLSFVGDPRTLAQTRLLLMELTRFGPVYVSRGTREVDGRRWMRELVADTGVVLLDNEGMETSVNGARLRLLGIPYEGDEDERIASLKRLIQPDSLPVILLHHSPDLIEAAAGMGVDLYLAGHTHGGQICLPGIGAIYTASRYRKQYAGGTYRVGTTAMVVSQGIGLEGGGAPRMRFLAPPEVVGVELEMGPGPDSPSPSAP